VDIVGHKEGHSLIPSIVSGSASTGQYLIQLSKLLGLRVICAASESNHAILEELGADLVLDRHTSAEQMIQRIKDITKGEVGRNPVIPADV